MKNIFTLGLLANPVQSSEKIRSFFLLLICLLSGSVLSAQTAGDFRSKPVTGFWSTATNWEYYNGTAWVAAPYYPGANSFAAGGTVTISDGSTITLNTTLSGTSGVGSGVPKLVVGNGTSGLLTFVTSYATTLRVFTMLTVNGGGSIDTGGAGGAAGPTLWLDGDAMVAAGGSILLREVDNGKLNLYNNNTISGQGTILVRYLTQMSPVGTPTIATIAPNFTVSGGSLSASGGGKIIFTSLFTCLNSTQCANGPDNLTFQDMQMGSMGILTCLNTQSNIFIKGDVYVSSTGGFGAGTVTFNGTADQTYTMAVGANPVNASAVNVTLNKPSGKLNIVNANLKISGALNLTSGVIAPDAASDITVTSLSNITGGNSTSYIQSDGTSGSESSLKVSNTGSAAYWQGNCPVGTAVGGYTPFIFNTVTTAPATGSVLAIKPILGSSALGKLKRVFRTVVTGNYFATTFSSASGSYAVPEDISSGNVATDYTVVYAYTSAAGRWTVVSGVSTGLSPYTFTISSPISLGTGTNYYTIGGAYAYGNTWYSTKNGNWSDWQSWTVDPSGTVLINPYTASPVAGDIVVIMGGTTIINDQNNASVYSTTINVGGVLDMGATTGNNLGVISGQGLLRVKGIVLPIGTYTAFVASTGGTIEYYDAGGILPSSRNSYNNLIFSNSAPSIPITFSQSISLTVFGNVTIGLGTTLNNTVYTISQRGANWTNNGSYIAGTGTVSFTGAAAQTISGSTTFYNLYLSQTVLATVTLAGTGTTTVNNTLRLTKGNLISSSSHGLVLTSGNLISGGSATSFIDGAAQMMINPAVTYTIPLGSVASNYYRPLVIANVNKPDTWTLSYNSHDPWLDGYPNSTKSASLGTVSSLEYWLISPSMVGTYADLTLSYNTGSYLPNGNNIGDPTYLRVAHWDGTQWDLPVTGTGSTVIQTGTNVSGTVQVTNVQSFSPFTLGSIQSWAPLPVQVVYFKGQDDGHGAMLEWKTLSEVNNDYFTVYRSVDGVNFEVVGKVGGHGTTNVANLYSLEDPNAINGKNYYRLSQTDFDGTLTYRDAIVVDVASKTSPLVTGSPNPLKAGEILNVETQRFPENSVIGVLVLDSNGGQRWTGVAETDTEGKLQLGVPTKEFNPGVYIVKVGSSTLKFVVY